MIPMPPDLPPVEWWPAATIEPFSDGTWQPTPEQPDPNPSVPECMLYQIEESDGSLYDVAAWEAARPNVWWLTQWLNSGMAPEAPIVLSTFGSLARHGYEMSVHCGR